MRLVHVSIKLLLVFILLCFSLTCISHPYQLPKDPGDFAEESRDEALRRLAAHIANILDDRQLAAQVIISGIDGTGQFTRNMRSLLTEYPAGGIMLFRYNLDIDNNAIRNLITEIASLVASESAVRLPGGADGEKVMITIPPFIAADHEGGSVNRFRRGVADLPAAASYWTARNEDRNAAIERIAADSHNAGKAIYSLGVNMNFAPVAEHLIYGNEFLKDRSFGPDPVFAADAAAAFITGMKQAGVLCVVKHFPGHGGADPHFFSSRLPGNRAALAEIAAPFEFLISNGHARAIMVAHTVVPAWDAVHTASLSPAIMGGWLRRELGFDGLIICDDFAMAASTSRTSEPAAIQALAAGADMVLVWPNDLKQTHEAIRAALNNGRLSRGHLRDAASRIIFEKLRMGLIVSN